MLSTIFLAATLSFSSALALPAGVEILGASDDTNTTSIATRDTPSYCTFEGNRGSFSYIDETANEQSGGTACFGWQTGTIACNAWGQSDINDMINAMAQQIAKDGQLQTSKVGKWTAGFALGTTAFDDRSITIPTHEITRVNAQGVKAADGAGALTYYFSRNGNIMSLLRTSC